MEAQLAHEELESMNKVRGLSFVGWLNDLIKC